jgi:hypothetical protein
VGVNTAYCSNVRFQSGPDSRVKPLTPYDGASIMNYCSGDFRTFSDTDPDVSDWRPTEYDKLGIEILYPKPAGISLRCGGCVYTDAGLLLRTDGLVKDEWSDRGAFPWWSSASLPKWKKGTTNALPSGATLAASAIGASGTISFSATNQWNNKVIVGSHNTQVDNAKWTGVVMSAL